MSIPNGLAKRKEAKLAALKQTPSEVVVEPAITGDQTIAPEVVEPIVAAEVEPKPVEQVVEQPKPLTQEISFEELQRLKTADGIAKATGEQLQKAQREKAELEQRVAILNETVDKLLIKPAEPAPAPVETPTPIIQAEEWTDDDAYVLGELEPSLRKLVRNELASVIPAFLDMIDKRVEPLKGRVDTTVKSVEEQKSVTFQQHVQANLNNYGYGNYNASDVHNSKEFSAWIIGKEDIHGDKYFDIYNKAVQTFDAKITTRILKEFLDSFTAQVTKETTVIPPSTPVVEQQQTEQSSIPEDMIAPPKTSGAGIPSGKTAVGVPLTLDELRAASDLYARTTAIGKIGGVTKEQLEDMRRRYLLAQEALKNAAGKK